LDIFIFAVFGAGLSNYLNPPSYFSSANIGATTTFWLGLIVYPFWQAILILESGTSFARVPFGLRIRDRKTGKRPNLDQAVTRSWAF
jgi:integral membrane sensor domain MASE1